MNLLEIEPATCSHLRRNLGPPLTCIAEVEAIFGRADRTLNLRPLVLAGCKSACCQCLRSIALTCTNAVSRVSGRCGDFGLLSGRLTEYFGNICGIGRGSAGRSDGRPANLVARAKLRQILHPGTLTRCVIGKTPMITSVNAILCGRPRSGHETGHWPAAMPSSGTAGGGSGVARLCESSEPIPSPSGSRGPLESEADVPALEPADFPYLLLRTLEVGGDGDQSRGRGRAQFGFGQERPWAELSPGQLAGCTSATSTASSVHDRRRQSSPRREAELAQSTTQMRSDGPG